MDDATATAIVNEARSRGIELPVEDEQEHAKQLVRMASSAYDSGARGEDVVAIMTMGGLLEPTNGEPMDHPTPPAPEPPGEPELSVRIEGFPVPPDPEGEPPEMPRDLTLVGDRECRKLHAEFNAWLVRVLYLIGIEKSDIAAAEHMRDQALRNAKKLVRFAAEQEGNAKISQAEVNSRAEGNALYEEWSNRLVQHQQRLSQLYAFRDIYAGNVERLSRDWRMRVDEFNMSGGKPR